MPDAPVRLLIVDDHPVVRDGLRGMFAGEPTITVVGEASDGPDALRQAERTRPDVILMDLRMPGGDGVAAIRALRAAGNPARVLVLTTYDTDDDVVAAIDAGATGYLLKDTPRDVLQEAVRRAADGGTTLSPSVAQQLLRQVRAPDGASLTPRELDVLDLVAQGATNREAGARLHISETTAKTHLLHAYAKLGVNDRAAAVARAYERGLLPRRDRPT